MMAGEDGVGQVVEALAAGPALVPLTMGLGVVAAVLDDRVGTTAGARRPVSASPWVAPSTHGVNPQ